MPRAKLTNALSTPLSDLVYWDSALPGKVLRGPGYVP